MSQDYLRKRLKLLKALQGISYKEISSYLDIKTNSLYNFIKGQYDLSYEKAHLLDDIISTLWEDTYEQ